jgi:hypothetical protein
VSYATGEAERLAAATTHVIELWLADQNLPLVVQQPTAALLCGRRATEILGA